MGKKSEVIDLKINPIRTFIINKKSYLIHSIPFLLCFWYICSYVLQPFPANVIATSIIAVITYTAYRNPAAGAKTAIFLVPLTFSLGKHLTTYFGDFAPPYLPYAEIILVSILWGWVWRAILNSWKPERFPCIQKDRTTFEILFLGLMGFWTILAIVGTIPALVVNFKTSPSLPWELLIIKVLFAPVWGMDDIFFPITASLRILLAFWIVYYVQRLISQKEIHASVSRLFICAMALVAAYGLGQFIFEIGYAKSSFSRYIQSTFHDNDSFASFNLMSLMMALPLVFVCKSFKQKFIYGACSILFFIAIFLSNSRAVMVLSVGLLISFLIIVWIKDRNILWRKRKELIIFACFLLAMFTLIALESPATLNKLSRLTADFELIEDPSFYSEKTIDSSDKLVAREKGGNLSLVARVKLWQNAFLMLGDSWGAGMGTGMYYRLTGFPRYQALSRLENAHMYWLQLVAELGLPMLCVILSILFISIYLCWTLAVGYSQQILAMAIIAFWFSNIVGQSLTQHEILWYFALLSSICFVYSPSFRDKLKYFIPSRKNTFIIIVLVLFVQVAAWGVKIYFPMELGSPAINQDTYGYAFDSEGHRYLQVGSSINENLRVPYDDAAVEFRVSAPSITEMSNDSLKIKAVLLDEYDRIHLTVQKILTGKGIQSVVLPIPDSADNKIEIILSVDRVNVHGNLIKSDERQLIGFHYYGYRWMTKNED